MSEFVLSANKDYEIGKISNHLFGSFIEHMGSVIYSGIYEPNHKLADDNGFRQDVLEMARDLELGCLRYPGGNYTSAYNWEDTIGTKEDRKVKLDIAWQGIESNEFGLHEFIEYATCLNTDVIFTLNLGTRGIKEATNIVEYCNFSGGTYWSDLRKKNGAEEPFNIKMWCLGNEMDGPWQIGAKTAEEYGRLANETSKAIKKIDSEIKTILVGSSTPRLNTYPEWDRIVLEEAYDNVDYLSLHNYLDKYNEADLTRPPKNETYDTEEFLAKSIQFENHIKEVIATCDYVKANKRSDKTIYLAFDEWNVHSQPYKDNEKFKIGSPIDWTYFTMEDSLLFGSMGLALLRNCNRVKIGCQSLLVNTIPLILTDKGGESWVNPTYFVFKDLSKYSVGTVLDSRLEAYDRENENIISKKMIDTIVVYNEESIVVYAVNKTKNDHILNFDLNFNSNKIRHFEMISDNIKDINHRDNPDKIKPTTKVYNDKKSFSLKKYSWNTFILEK